MGSTTPPIYTMATAPTPSAAGVAASSGAHQPPPISGIFSGGTDGTLIYGGGGYSGGALSAEDSSAAAPNGAHAPPKFYKLEFPTFDGAVYSLNWLNLCEQFFCGQRALASDRTWLASYHLRGAAQTWYYALEQDEGMPTWERFRDLCQLRFGPPTHDTWMAELALLPFQSSVQEYSDRYNVVLCHACDLNPRYKVNVEMRDPPDLQTAMYLARAFERRAAAMPPAPLQQGARPPQRPGLPPRVPGGGPPPAGAPVPPGGGPAAANGAPPVCQFRRLTPDEQLERRRQGLCFNCDEPYVRGHVCPRLFYLESDDYIDDGLGDAAAMDDVANPAAPDA